jgi:hypothetical protein
MYSIPKNTSKKNSIKKKIDQKNEKPKLTKNELKSDVLKQVSILDYFQKNNNNNLKNIFEKK